jgi:nitrite reductase (NO-forming)
MPFPGLKTENERRDVIAYLVEAGAGAAPAASPPPAATAAPAASPQRSSVSYIPDIRYTLRSGIAEGRMVFIVKAG